MLKNFEKFNTISDIIIDYINTCNNTKYFDGENKIISLFEKNNESILPTNISSNLWLEFLWGQQNSPEMIDKKNHIYDIIDIKKFLESIFGGFIIGLCTDETDDLFLINVNSLLEHIDYQNNFYDIISNSKSIIIDKKSNKIIIEFLNIVNHNIERLAEKIDWKNVIVTYIYPGINLYLFNHNDNWILSSENLLNIHYDNKGYGTLDDILKKLLLKINIDELDKKYYYHIIFQNNKTKNFVDNCLINNENNEFIFISAYQKYNYKIVDCEIININKIQNLHFSCVDEMIIKLDYISYDNKINKKLTYSGFNVKVYDEEKQTNNIYIYSDIYKKINDNMIEGDNIYKIYLELYQKNKLSNILPYLSKYSNEIIHRLNMSMKTLSREILNIYHTTRKKKHQEMYKLLPELYKKILYGIHGVYINSRKKDLINRVPVDYDETKSITVHDVYYYVKELTHYQLIQLFKERTELLKNSNFNNIMSGDCIYTLTQAKLMSN